VEEGSIPSVFTYKWKGQELVQLLDKGRTVFLSFQEGSHCTFQVQQHCVHFGEVTLYISGGAVSAD
jgi:hypothetical protein